MTIQQIIEKDGLKNLCKLFGWQGGTREQVKTEMRRRFAKNGIAEHKITGQLVTLNFK